LGEDAMKSVATRVPTGAEAHSAQRHRPFTLSV